MQKQKIKVLSLFDGISVAQQALKELGYDVEYYASEIDKYAISLTQKNHPNTYQMGSVLELGGNNPLPTNVDLIIGGSPCQDLSIAKKNRQGLDGARSGLFWEYVRILKEVEPKYFVLENVNSMPKEAKAIITEALGVEPIMINAALVSAQNRKRLFWTNIPNVTLPEDRGILLKDILEKGTDTDRMKSYCIDASYYKGANWRQYKEKGRRQLVIGTQRIGELNSGGQGDRIYSPEGKSVGLSALGGGRGAKTGLYLTESGIKNLNRDSYGAKGTIVTENSEKTKPILASFGTGGGNGIYLEEAPSVIRKLTPIECERLQSLPDNYTEGISNSQRYKCLGNAFNKEVVKHILSFMK